MLKSSAAGHSTALSRQSTAVFILAFVIPYAPSRQKEAAQTRQMTKDLPGRRSRVVSGAAVLCLRLDSRRSWAPFWVRRFCWEFFSFSCRCRPSSSGCLCTDTQTNSQTINQTISKGGLTPEQLRVPVHRYTDMGILSLELLANKMPAQDRWRPSSNRCLCTDAQTIGRSSKDSWCPINSRCLCTD